MPDVHYALSFAASGSLLQEKVDSSTSRIPLFKSEEAAKLYLTTRIGEQFRSLLVVTVVSASAIEITRRQGPEGRHTLVEIVE